MKFRKKPVVIEAWRNEAMSPPPEWVLAATGIRNPSDGSLAIKTLEGVMIAKQGDWVIKGVAGEVYPCKPDIFVATYEPVEKDPPLGMPFPEEGTTDTFERPDPEPDPADEYARAFDNKTRR